MVLPCPPGTFAYTLPVAHRAVSGVKHAVHYGIRHTVHRVHHVIHTVATHPQPWVTTACLRLPGGIAAIGLGILAPPLPGIPAHDIGSPRGQAIAQAPGDSGGGSAGGAGWVVAPFAGGGEGPDQGFSGSGDFAGGAGGPGTGGGTGPTTPPQNQSPTGGGPPANDTPTVDTPAGDTPPTLVSSVPPAPVPVPEPSSLLIFSAALLVISLIRRWSVRR